MRIRLIAMGLLALALQGCGGGDTTSGGKPAAGPPTERAAAPSAKRRAAAVILVRRHAADAAAEAHRLGGLGVASVTVDDPRSVGALRVALATLRRRPDVDPARIGIVAEGRAALLAVRLVAREPVIAAAALGDAPAAAAASLRELRAHVLLQRGRDGGSATKTAAQRLVTAAPMGTLLYEHPSLRDAAATQQRDVWLRRHLG